MSYPTRLNQWIPGSKSDYFVTQSFRQSGPQFGPRHFPGCTCLDEDSARTAWMKWVTRVRNSVGYDLPTSDEAFVSGALAPYSEEVAPDWVVPTRCEQWVVLPEGKPFVGFLVKTCVLTVSELPECVPDYCIGPWPRMNWMLMRTHFGAGPPRFIDFRR